MRRLSGIKGIIFDYGGTIDTNGKHWAEVLWDGYAECGVPVEKEQFKEAYVHGERTLALNPLIRPEHNFYDVLFIKAGLQVAYLSDKGYLQAGKSVETYPEQIAQYGYRYVLNVLEKSRIVVEKLFLKYNLILVSNFYGNIKTVLDDFSLLCFFKEVVESAVVGVRKPDPAIFLLGVKALGYKPEEVVVVGDSFSKDIIPAKKVGCKAVWLKGTGWDEETDESLPDVVVSDLGQLLEVVQ